MAKGLNATIRTGKHGSYRVRAVGLGYGLGVIATQEESKQRRAFYPLVTTSSSFTITLAFVSWEERERFNKWMSNFMEKVVNGRGFHAAMEIRVPSRDFIRTAVPEGPIEYGEGVTDVGYEMSISFVGSSDPVDPSKGAKAAELAYFEMPGKKKGRQISKHFYPAGHQLAGTGDLDGAIFDHSFGDEQRTPLSQSSQTPSKADLAKEASDAAQEFLNNPFGLF